MDICVFTPSHRARFKKNEPKNQQNPPCEISHLSYLPCSWGQVPSLCTQMWAANHPVCLELCEPPGIMPTACQTLGKVKILTPTQAMGALGFWCCWGVHTHLPETARVHELLGEAWAG